jgi:hypothetical protein
MSSAKVLAHRHGSWLGTFLVGLIAGMCAVLFPRLTALIFAPTAESSFLEMNAFSLRYIIFSVVFALLIGIVVMILEWGVKSTPGQIFMAALGVPALIAGAVNSGAISSNAAHLGQELQNITDQYREANDIPVKDENLKPISSVRPSFVDIGLIPAAFGQTSEAGRSIAGAQKGGGADIGVFRQKEFWIVLYTTNTRDDAERKLEEFGTQYGKLTIQQFQNQFAVTLASTLPYSQAVSAAVDVKRQSGETLAPVLVPAK